MRKGKRWYFDASLSKSIPFVGGSSLRMGSGALTKRSITQAVRAQVIRTQENKQKIVNSGASSGMTHSTIYTFNPLGNIPIQTGQNGRIGSEIFIKNIILRMNISNRAAAAAAIGRDSATFLDVCGLN